MSRIDNPSVPLVDTFLKVWHMSVNLSSLWHHVEDALNVNMPGQAHSPLCKLMPFGIFEILKYPRYRLLLKTSY